MKIKPNYFIIPLLALATALVGGLFTAQGLGPRWYSTIMKPEWIPQDSVYGIVWTIIFTLTAISALIVWNRAPRDVHFHELIGLFVVNALLNILWSALFFTFHVIGLAAIEAAILGIETSLLAWRIWQKLPLAAILLLPYVLWVVFATFLTYAIWTLN